MGESITLSKPKENIQNKRYNYIVGIDFGTYSTSFSFVHVDFSNDIQTIKYWDIIDNIAIPGRVSSSIIYKEEGSVPLWGNSANKKNYHEESDFFYTPHIKPYLTDTEHQPKLPGSLTPVRLLSDYLKQLHHYGVDQMKAYFHSKNQEIEVESIDIAFHGISLNKESRQPVFNVTEDQIRYIISYPDNQMNGAYNKQMREALEMAGIISSENPEQRLKFIPESSATAYFCSNIPNLSLEPSKKPYLVCDIGGKVFGISTIISEELMETGIIETHIDQAAVGCGNLELDRNMRRYLENRITASSEDSLLLKRVLQELFDFYIDEIKTSFSDDPYSTDDNFYTIVGISNSSIKSDLLDEETFVFSYGDMKGEIFDPVTDSIIENIDTQIKRLDIGISGIFLSGTIGEHGYLKSLVNRNFGTTEIKIISIENSAFAVSEGLIYAGARERGLMIPYFESKEVRQKQKILIPGGNEPFASGPSVSSRVKKIRHKDLDFIIGLDFGTTYSGFAYAPVPKNEEQWEKSHIQLIKEISIWPKRSYGNYPKVPSTLYYNQKMEYMNKFGYEAKGASDRVKADGVLLRHFKLLLSRDFAPRVDDKLLKNLENFDIVESIAHFVKDFYKEGISRMRRGGLEIDEEQLVFVITIPAMWSDEAKNTMRAAVKKAGLIKSEDDLDRVAFITEAEAAALYCEKFYKEEFSMHRNQRIMICDAGGGTVDLVTFKIVQEDGPGEVLMLSELTSGDGDGCGSVFIDENFRKYIMNKLSQANILCTEKSIERIVEDFNREIKPNFEPSLYPDTEDDIKLQIPMNIGLPSDFVDDTGFIQDNEIVIPYADMEKEVFKPVIDRVLKLIDRQLRKLPAGETQLDAILLVGGFGQSSYLHRKITERFEKKEIGAMTIVKPPNGDLSICKGAVSFGLEPRLVSKGFVHYTYGLQVKDLFKEQNNPSYKIIGYDGREYSQNVFCEIVSKGTKISKGTVYVVNAFVIYPNDPIFAIYSTDDKGYDKDLCSVINTGNIQPICKLYVKTPVIPKLKEGDKVEFQLIVEITGTSISVDVLYEGKLLTDKILTHALSGNKYRSDYKGKKKQGVSIISLNR